MPLYKLTSRRLARKERDEMRGLSEIKARIREELGEGSGSESGSGSSWSEEDDEDDDEDDEGTENDEQNAMEEIGEVSVGTLDSEEDSSDEDNGDEDKRPGKVSKRKRSSANEDDDEEAVETDEEDVDDDGDGDDEEDTDDEPFPITLESALSDPIYAVSLSSSGKQEAEMCVLCPGKLLKNAEMVVTHLKSALHQRSAKRYAGRLARAEKDPLPSEDPRAVVDSILAEVEERKEGAQSAEKPRQKSSLDGNGLSKQKAKRVRRKERQAGRTKGTDTDMNCDNNGSNQTWSAHETSATKYGVERRDGAEGRAGKERKAPRSLRTEEKARKVLEVGVASATDVKLNRKVRRMAARAGVDLGSLVARKDANDGLKGAEMVGGDEGDDEGVRVKVKEGEEGKGVAKNVGQNQMEDGDKPKWKKGKEGRNLKKRAKVSA